MFVKSGLNHSRGIGSGYQSSGLREYTLSGVASDLFQGAPVKLVNGNTLSVAVEGEDAIGVFQGINFVDNSGEPRFRNFMEASTPTKPNEKITALVMVDPSVTFHIPANAAADSSDIGSIFALTGETTGNTMTGQSDAVVDVVSGSTTAALGSVEVVGIVPEVQGTADANAPVLEVRLINHALRG